MNEIKSASDLQRNMKNSSDDHPLEKNMIKISMSAKSNEKDIQSIENSTSSLEVSTQIDTSTKIKFESVARLAGISSL